LLPPLIAGFLLSGPVVAIGFATLAGAATIATFAVTIVMGQEYLPGRLGVAAGVTIGLSIGLGGVGAPLLGVLGDAHGLTAVFETIAVLPLLALGLSLALPTHAPSVSRPASSHLPSGEQAASRRPTPAQTTGSPS
jgi:FSR family fosmidomycin resistance protein-like MFS transporter